MSQATPVTRVRYAVMFLLCVLAFLTYFDRVCIMRAQNDIMADLHITDVQMGWVMGAFWLAYALFEIPAGWVGDRWGARTGLSRVVVMWSIFTALSGSATGFVSLLACRFLFGAGEAGAFPGMARVQQAWLPVASRGRAGGLLWLMARWGGAFSPLIFGSMLRGLDSAGFRSGAAALPGMDFVRELPAWRMGFFVSGLLGLVWVGVFYIFFRDDPAQKRSVSAGELELIRRDRRADEITGHGMPRHLWVSLFSSRSLWALAAVYLLITFPWSFLVSWFPKYLLQVHGVKFDSSELQSGLPLLCGGIACLMGGVASDWVVKRTGWVRWGRVMFPMIGYTVAGAAMFGVQFARTPDEAVALVCLAAWAHDFGQAALWACVVNIGGIYAGTAFGLINMVGNMSNFIQPPIGAWIFGRPGWGWPVLFGVYASFYLLAVPLWLLIDPTKRFYRAADEETQPAPA